MAIILVVDDEVGIRELLSEILIDEGYDVRLAENAQAARKARQEIRPDLVLLDIWMPDTDGISLLKEWHGSGQLSMPVVIMSGHGTIDTAVEATRFGACDFLEKPVSLQKLLSTVQKALKSEAPQASAPLTLDAFAHLGFIKEFRRRLEQTAGKAPMLLLRGASGPMAEMVARSLQVARTPWLDLSSLSSPLSQEQLEKCNGGILFVPDLAALSKMQQMSLVFASERVEKLNVRLLCATALTPVQLVEQGWDNTLVQRLSAVWLNLPSLANQADELPDIARILLDHLIGQREIPQRRWSSAALANLHSAARKRLDENSWNALHGLIKNLALSALEEEISIDDLHRVLPQNEGENEAERSLLPLFEQPLREARDTFEKLYFEFHLRQENGNMTRLAERSGLERTHLYRKLKQLDVRQGRRGEE
ncbi:sigma-54-dependent transcriptional regulator [Azonexus sp.]|uniref:sigma-54-dependent transcriptional regulator n=1 Tax=Azonexus sp. TaxID=1872668 RepID=UPI0039E54F8B